MMSYDELKFIRELLEALFRKCKSDALREWTFEGLSIVKREMDIEIIYQENIK
jgi:hypothetical protein